MSGMTDTEIYEVELCSDCTFIAANGTDRNPELEAIEWPGVPAGWHVVPGHVHRLDICGDAVVEGCADCPYDEPSFSMTPCDACRRPLGGDRYPGAMWDTTRAKVRA